MTRYTKQEINDWIECKNETVVGEIMKQQQADIHRLAEYLQTAIIELDFGRNQSLIKHAEELLKEIRG